MGGNRHLAPLFHFSPSFLAGCRVARMLELVSQETAVPNGDLWKSLLWPLVVTRTELQYYLLPLGSEPQPMTAPPGPVRALSAADDNLATWATAQEKGVVVVATGENIF